MSTNNQVNLLPTRTQKKKQNEGIRISELGFSSKGFLRVRGRSENEGSRRKLGVLYGTNAGGEKNPICDVSLKIMPKLVLWEQVAKAGVVNAGY